MRSSSSSRSVIELKSRATCANSSRPLGVESIVEPPRRHFARAFGRAAPAAERSSARAAPISRMLNSSAPTAAIHDSRSALRALRSDCCKLARHRFLRRGGQLLRLDLNLFERLLGTVRTRCRIVAFRRRRAVAPAAASAASTSLPVPCRAAPATFARRCSRTTTWSCCELEPHTRARSRRSLIEVTGVARDEKLLRVVAHLRRGARSARWTSPASATRSPSTRARSRPRVGLCCT